MYKPFLCFVLLGLAIQVANDLSAQSPSSTGEKKNGDAAGALQSKLTGKWYGPACGGNYTFNADGTYAVENYTPGQNLLTGTWSVRWDALPPTLVLVCKTSDFTKNGSTRAEYEFLDKPVELKLVVLNDAEFAYHAANDKYQWHFARDRKTGGHVKKAE